MIYVDNYVFSRKRFPSIF